jgi:hypothetical protein
MIYIPISFGVILLASLIIESKINKNNEPHIVVKAIQFICGFITMTFTILVFCDTFLNLNNDEMDIAGAIACMVSIAICYPTFIDYSD